MTSEQLDDLERQFGLSFPNDYRNLLCNYPFNQDSEELTSDAEALLESNLGCRREDPFEFPWHEHFWWIGDDGSGGFRFIDCRESDATVYYFDHEVPADDFSDRENLKPRPLSECISDMHREEAEYEEERRLLLKKIANRKWWQFWIPNSPPS